MSKITIITTKKLNEELNKEYDKGYNTGLFKGRVEASDQTTRIWQEEFRLQRDNEAQNMNKFCGDVDTAIINIMEINSSKMLKKEKEEALNTKLDELLQFVNAHLIDIKE